MHLILEVEAEKAVESYVERIKNNLRDDLRDRGIPFGKLETGEGPNRSGIFRGAKEKWDNLLTQRFTGCCEKLTPSRGGRRMEGGAWFSTASRKRISKEECR